jgi:hypothetical protein
MEAAPKDTMHFSLRGHLRVIALGNTGVVWQIREHNLICDDVKKIILGLFGRDLDNKMISYISIGTGGDLNPATLLDTGARVGPQPQEDKMRREIHREYIANVESDEVNLKNIYTAVAAPENAISNDINELGLFSNDGTMMAHFVTDPDIGGRAKTYQKTALLYLVIRWTWEPVLHRE